MQTPVAASLCQYACCSPHPRTPPHPLLWFGDVQNFEAEVYALTKEEGGRHTPFTSNYKPQFFMRTADVVGEQGGTLGQLPCMSVEGAVLLPV